MWTKSKALTNSRAAFSFSRSDRKAHVTVVRTCIRHERDAWPLWLNKLLHETTFTHGEHRVTSGTGWNSPRCYRWGGKERGEQASSLGRVEARSHLKPVTWGRQFEPSRAWLCRGRTLEQKQQHDELNSLQKLTAVSSAYLAFVSISNFQFSSERKESCDHPLLPLQNKPKSNEQKQPEQNLTTVAVGATMILWQEIIRIAPTSSEWEWLALALQWIEVKTLLRSGKLGRSCIFWLVTGVC